MKRIICWLRGHDWKVIGGDLDRNAMMLHLHPLARLDADCRRCGAEWRDAPAQPPERGEKTGGEKP